MIIKRDHLFSLLLVVCAGLAIMISGCSHESDDIPSAVTNANILMEKGWADFLGGDYSSAITRFQQILSRDATITEAYVGLGWAYTYAGTFDKGLSNFIFSQARPDFGPYEAEVYAGMASNYAASNEDSIAVRYAQKTLDMEPEWVFRKDPALTAHDLKVLIAQSYFNEKKYYNAKEQVDAMDQNWSQRFPTTAVTDMITPLEWTVSSDSVRVSFQLHQAGVDSFDGTGTVPTPMASTPVPGINVGLGTMSEVTVSENVQTEYWTMTCSTAVKKGGIFSVVGSKSGRHTDYDILTGAYTSDNGEVTFRITSDRRKYFEVGDSFTFMTTAPGFSFTVDQIKGGNRVFIYVDPGETDARFFKDVDYTIFLEYSYYDDFGNFVLQLLEKINSLFQ